MKVRTTHPEAASIYREGVELTVAMYMATDAASTAKRLAEFLMEHKVVPVSVILPGWEEVPSDDPSP